MQGDGTTETGVPRISDLSTYCCSMQRLAKRDIALLLADYPSERHANAFFYGPAATRFVHDTESIADRYPSLMARLLAAQGGPISLLDLGTRLAHELGFVQPNPYLLMLASACLDEMVEMGQAWRISGYKWQPENTFSAA